jgi:antitoxin VapB
MLRHMTYGEVDMQTKRSVRLFRNGRSQAVRIPKELELPGSEAMIYRDGDRLVLEAKRKQTLEELLASWEPIDEEFPEIDDPPPEPVEF